MAFYRIRTPLHDVPLLIEAPNAASALSEAARAAEFELEELTAEAFALALKHQAPESHHWEEYWEKELLLQRLAALPPEDLDWIRHELDHMRGN